MEKLTGSYKIINNTIWNNILRGIAYKTDYNNEVLKKIRTAAKNA